MPRKRLSLDLASWPEPEQHAWARAIERRPLFGGRALAAGWAPATRAGVVQAWLHSEGHRRNLLDPNVSEMGADTRADAADLRRQQWVLVMGRQ